MARLDPRLPALPCPECLERASRRHGKKVYPGRYRIGNQRGRGCTTCNNFNQAVMRLTRSRLMAKFADEYARLRVEVERDLYPQVIQEWERKHPWVADPDAEERTQRVVEVPLDPDAPLTSVGAGRHRVSGDWSEEDEG